MGLVLEGLVTLVWPYEVMRDRLVRVTDGLAEAIVELEGARESLRRAHTESGTEIARVARALRRALGGMSLDRWEALMSGRAYLRTARDSRDANLARRRRVAVEEALAEVHVAEAAGVETIESAQARLEEAVRGLERFGPLAAWLSRGGDLEGNVTPRPPWM